MWGISLTSDLGECQMQKGEKERLQKAQALICPNCGESYDHGDTFCTACGETLHVSPSGVTQSPAEVPGSQVPELVVAEGGQRFWAFIIDLIIIAIISGLLSGILGFATEEQFFWNFGPFYVVAFVYYVATEVGFAQTVGKMALGTEVVDQNTGEPVTGEHITKLLINNFGKAFLFPIDVIVGWILADRWKKEIGVDLKQRLFQRMAGLVVVKKTAEPPSAKFASSD